MKQAGNKAFKFIDCLGAVAGCCYVLRKATWLMALLIIPTPNVRFGEATI